MDNRAGLIQVYTGDGKGKTTAAVGQVVRASGSGLRCHIVQFMKNEIESGELTGLRALPGVTVKKFGGNLLRAGEKDFAAVREGLAEGVVEAKEAVVRDYDVVVLDEILTAVHLGLIDESELIKLIVSKQPALEVILTGRGASPKIIEIADYVTEMRMIKHPFEKGISARQGIEF